MTFRIEYYRDEVKVAAVSCPKSKADAQTDAIFGLGVYDADVARILNMDDNGKVVGTVRRDA